jgi:two-component system NarL family response regulator
VSAPIRILVVEDNYVMRLGTVTLLRGQPDLELVGEADDGAPAIELYRALKPDVVLADLRLPHFDGAQLAGALARETPPGRVLVFSHHASEQDLVRALGAGALGYVTKEIRPNELLEAVRLVARGERYLPPDLAARVQSALLQAPLSRRENQVLRLIADGLGNREIADRLQLAERTVIMYVSNILTKTGTRTRTEAVAVAIKRGLMPPPG